MIVLRPMTDEELRAWLEALIPEYAAGHVRTGRWDPRDALARSRAEIEPLLPQGTATPDHFVRAVVEPKTGSRVGEVWYVLRRDAMRPELYVYWVGIDPRFRRRGYATEVFRLLEEEAGRLGADRIGLHVFGENVEARRLYERLGFVATNVVMAKRLQPPTN